MNILGISAFYHDSAASLVRDGRIIAAAQEERFTRKKHDAGFPANAVDYCLQAGGIAIDDIDYVAYYEKPLLKFERLLATYLACAPRGFLSFLRATPLWLKERLWIKGLLMHALGYDGKIVFPEHHQSHAASAFFPSPFERAAILTMDGVGEWCTTSYGLGVGNRCHLLSEISFPHSLGLLYSAFTYYTGFRVNSGEYKVMGLAPYGEPRYVDTILSELIDLKDDGSFHLNMKYFDFAAGLKMTNEHFHELFGGPPRVPESPLRQRDLDLARSIQEVTEEVVLRVGRHIRRVTQERTLVMAGGVALNCVANGKLLRARVFDDIWFQPAAGDAGGSLGAALFTWHDYLGNERKRASQDAQAGSYLGPEFSDQQIEEYLSKHHIPYEPLSADALPSRVAELIAQEKVIGWFEGRMEFGPRALGARSIVADARSSRMQEMMNLKIKFRESFRPFAPSVLAEYAGSYFDLDRPSPYMMLVADVTEQHRKPLPVECNELWGLAKLKLPRSDIPAVTHVDNTARVQTVHKETNGLYHALLSSFYEQYDCPLVVNTSFNVRGEPIVCTPEDAYRCFMRTGIDYLVVGHFLLDKNAQPKYSEDHRHGESKREMD